MSQSNLPDRAIWIEICIVEQGFADGFSLGSLFVATPFVSLLIDGLLLVQVLVKLLDFLDELFIIDDSLFALLMYPHFVLIDGMIVGEA